MVIREVLLQIWTPGSPSPPSAINEAAYSRVTKIHPVTAYVSPAGITSRRVIRGVDTDFDDATLSRMLIQPRNLSLLGARPIKNTAAVILRCNGLEVPNYIHCGQVTYCCTLYKCQIHTCRNCGQVGLRQDVCPTPSTKPRIPPNPKGRNRSDPAVVSASRLAKMIMIGEDDDPTDYSPLQK
ncbi:hypothetical protein HPB52_022786 [Rhipicephalus sanguineus]|uniref:Uncharacterized protein n=1 Tax=Rhipicephalus sanguineus TaxID=34632 RepID=A0A9D4Q7S5_RHISA|nr:hypothetical protein HPB52_022786 [Rhipicephalus sanguineus]